MKLGSARITALALGFSCLFLGGVIVRTREVPTTSELSRRSQHLFPAFDAELVQTITIARPKTQKPPLIIERDAHESDVFRLGGKEGRRADPGLVTSLLRALEQETVQRRYDKPPESARALLDPPDFLLTLEMQRGMNRLLLGRGDAYLMAELTQKDGRPQYAALGEGLAEHLERSEEEFSVRALFPIAKSETRELVLTRGTGELRLRPSAFGFSVGENGARADHDLVDALFFQLARSELEVVRARASVEAAQAKEPGLVTVEQRGTSGGLTRVRLGGACDPSQEKDSRVLALELEGELRAGCVDGAIQAALAIETDRFLDRRVVPLRADEIDHIVLDGPGGVVDLIRKDDGFEMTDEHGRRPVDKASGTRLLRALSDAKGTPTDGTKPQAAPGTLRIVGHGAGDLVIDENVSFWKEGGRLLIQRGDGIMLALPERDATAFEKASLWLRDRTVLALAADSVTVLNVAHGSVLRRLERSPQGFRFAPEGELADARLVAELLDALGHLEASAFLDVPPPRISPSLSIGFVSSARTGVLSIYKRLQGGFLTTLTGQPDPFLLEPGVVERLGRSLQSRADASFDLSAATRVVLAAGSPDARRTLELRREGGVLRAQSDQETSTTADFSTQLEALTPLWARPDLRKPTSGAVLSLRIESEERSPLELTFYKVPGSSASSTGDIVGFNSRSPLGFSFDERTIARLLDSF